jgi:phosphoribosylformimino-5-aminoimidazole carboxamide ribotide isomerase
MRIIPVLDLLDSVVVRGIAGQRDKYRPVESDIAASSNPLDVAIAFRETFGFNRLYVADLDAILNGEPNWPVYGQLRQEGFELLIDAGITNAVDAAAVLGAGANSVIAGLETWPLLSSLEMLVNQFGDEKILFSLDLKNGQPVARLRDLLVEDPADIGACVLEAGVRELIVLDLGSVGTGTGVSTVELCRELKNFAPRCRLVTGGGVRNAADLAQLAATSVDSVLVASALHDGSITPQDLARYRG